MSPHQAEIDRLLRDRTFDVRGLDPPGFRRWLARQVEHWSADPVFRQRAVIRELRRAHPRLRELEAEHRRASRADEAGPYFGRLEELTAELVNAVKAVEGLTAAFATAAPERRRDLAVKADAFRGRIQALEAERMRLEASAPERQALRAASDAVNAARASIGIDREEEHLRELQARRGRGTVRAGELFEHTVEELVRQHVIPESPSAHCLRVLHGVRLGSAGVEFDLLLVKPGCSQVDPVVVLAAVEAKRNVNDLAHGFLHRQRDLAWLTGERDRYDPTQFRTQGFPGGHFDRDAIHPEGDTVYRFNPASFRHFRRDPESNWFTDRLFLITRPGWVWGLSAANLSRLAARVATDEELNLDDPALLAGLFEWVKGLAGRTETPDVLRLYAPSPNRAGHLFLVGH